MPRRSVMAHAGDRDLLITIQRMRDEDASSDSGFPVESFTELAPLQFWAKREFVSMGEDVRFNQISASTVQRWQIPYSAQMDPDLVNVPKTRRLQYKERVYDIQAAEILAHENGREIVLTTLAQT